VGSPTGHEELHQQTTWHDAAAVLARLRAEGHRVTSARRAVIEILAWRAEHLTADQIALALSGTEVHRATVYRTLETFTELGVVARSYTPSGAAAYHIAYQPEGDEHYHAHCRTCGTVVVVSAEAVDEIVEVLRRTSGFALKPSQSVLVGACADCAS